MTGLVVRCGGCLGCERWDRSPDEVVRPGSVDQPGGRPHSGARIPERPVTRSTVWFRACCGAETIGLCLIAADGGSHSFATWVAAVVARKGGSFGGLSNGGEGER